VTKIMTEVVEDAHRSHYATIVKSREDVELYQLGDLDCVDCLWSMVTKLEAVAGTFRARLTLGTCRVHDAACINPNYCVARGACCAGDLDCVPAGGKS